MIEDNEYKTLYGKGKYTINKLRTILKYTPHIDDTVYEFSGIIYKKYLTKNYELIFISIDRDENQYYKILRIGEEYTTGSNKVDNISYKNNAQYSYRNKYKYHYENGIATYLKIVAWGYLLLSFIIALIFLFSGSAGVIIGFCFMISGIIINALSLGISEIIILVGKKNK